ncbi:zinc-ribbon domain-containing protein [Luteolibacter flavescens]|uniref:Zinc-ribbon domain-containing protein n=1 Tax=Luteolibacter flavescens TaxID=1859460 RepID=A0ABT3FXT6_9BACT|nr:zinc-ribbon domain-containing protein [Luteolibacter flavescens]MCW1887815.1 zinc-ribbon domain-containing protein [Luteolibacter flavescens]
MASSRQKREQLAAKKSRKRLKRRQAELTEQELRIKGEAAARRLIAVDSSKIRSRSVMPSRDVPLFAGKYYLDYSFTCIDCRSKQVWTGLQQKWWHEDFGADWERIAVRCRDCRRKERSRRDEARKTH